MVARPRSTRFGHLDVAFANAGFGAARGFLRIHREHWRSMVLTNVYGAALTIRATLPALKSSHGASAADRIRRRAPGAARFAVLGHQWAVTAMGESARRSSNGPACGSR